MPLLRQYLGETAGKFLRICLMALARMAGDFLAQLLGLFLEFDFCQDDALQNAAVDVDMPRGAGILDGETLLSPAYRLDTTATSAPRMRKAAG